MASNDEITLRTAFRSSPLHMGCYVLIPLVLAAAQLLNALFTGFPAWAAVAFAGTMVGYAVLYARIHRSHLRLRSLEATAGAPSSAAPVGQ